MERRPCTAPTAPSARPGAGHSGSTDVHEDRHHCLHSQDAGGWVRSLAVATFDVGTGHTLEQVYPPDSLDEGDRQRIRMLAMPDCNTTQIGDCFYCFRTRKSHRLPLLSSSLLDQTFEYCYAFFRQEKNEECARGMFQKSVVLVSRYPYVNLFERLVKVIGPLYFAHGPAVLEAVFASLEEWPAPCPGALCPLPFLSETVMFQVPDIDMPPQVASKYRYHRGPHLCSLWPRARTRSLTRTMSGCGSLDFSQSSPGGRCLSASESQVKESDERSDVDEDNALYGSNGNDGNNGHRGSGLWSAGTADTFSSGNSFACRGSGHWSVTTADGMDGLEELEASTARLAERLGGISGSVDKEGDAKPSAMAQGATTSTSTTPQRLRVGTPLFTPPDGLPQPANGGRSRDQSALNVDAATSDTLRPLVLDSSGRAMNGSVTDPRNGSWEDGDDAPESPSTARGGSRGCGETAPFWHSAARSPGVLLSPGLQEGAGGIDGAAASRKRSSLGAGSLASVVSNSPSENWLTTPKSVSSPLMVLDSTSGSNLAQSCYYVADRDSEESDDEEVEPEGWQGEGQGSSDAEESQDEEKREIVFSLSGGVSGKPLKAGVDADARIAEAAVPVGGSGGVREMRDRGENATALDAALASAATAAALQKDERTAGVGRDQRGRRGRPISLSPPRTNTTASTAANVQGAQSHTSTNKLLSRSTRAATTGATPVGASPGNARPWSGLRAWADAAPEDPWHAPPPLSPSLGTRSKSANGSPFSGIARRVWPAFRTPERDGEQGDGNGDGVQRDVEACGDRGWEKGGNMADRVVEQTDGIQGQMDSGSSGDGKRQEDATSSAFRNTEESINGFPSDVNIVVANKAAASSGDGGGGGGVRYLLEAAERSGAVQGVASDDLIEDGAAADSTGDARTEDGDGAGSGNGNAVGMAAVGRLAASRCSDGGKPPAAAGSADRYASDTVDGNVSGGGGGVGGESKTKRAGAGRVDGETEKDKRDDSDGAAAGKGRIGTKRSFRTRMGGRRALGQDGRPGPWTSNSDRRSGPIHRTASTLQGGRSPFAEMLLADEARFRAKQGLFQSIGLYSIFGKKLVEHLWLLWELVLTGGPTLVVGSSVGASSAAILGMVSLASPVYFGGDFRPHFTTFDPDYREIVAAHDNVSKQQLWGSSVLGVQATGSRATANGGFPSILLGVINPIFLRTLSRWPNAIVLPGAAGRSVSGNAPGSHASLSRTGSGNPAMFHKLQRELSDDRNPSSPRNRHCPTPKMESTPASRRSPVRILVIRAGASLDQVVGQDDRPDEPIIIARQQPVMVPDVAVLSRLLDPGCPYNPAMAAQAAAVAASNGSQSSPSTPTSAGVAAMAAQAAAAAKGGKETRGQWKDSLRAINDVILRRHFADLTRSFLAPYDKYFRRSRPPQQLTPWQQKALARLSVYTDPGSLMSTFSEEEFLAEMSVTGPPKGFAHVSWETLYRRFMESPNFRPWFTTQRIEGADRLREFNRTVCLRTSPAALVESCAPSRLPQLLAKIKGSIAREWQKRGSSVDWELLERMEMHQAAVEAAIRVYNNSPGAAAGSMQP